MTVYVDDARISATVGRHTSLWSHLTADTKDELHAFAARLGLHRAWFQTCVANRKKCPPSRCPHWHYDVTDGKRFQALRLGAQPMDIHLWEKLIADRRASLPAMSQQQGVNPS